MLINSNGSKGGEHGIYAEGDRTLSQTTLNQAGANGKTRPGYGGGDGGNGGGGVDQNAGNGGAPGGAGGGPGYKDSGSGNAGGSGADGEVRIFSW